MRLCDPSYNDVRGVSRWTFRVKEPLISTSIPERVSFCAGIVNTLLFAIQYLEHSFWRIVLDPTQRKSSTIRHRTDIYNFWVVRLGTSLGAEH